MTGLDAFRRFCLDWFEPWDSVYADVEQIFAGVYHVRDGKVPQVEFYTNRAAALEAAGQE